MNSSVRMKRYNTLKTLKAYLANKNKQKEIPVKKQSKLIIDINNEFKKAKKNNKDNLKIAGIIHKSAILLKKNEEDYNIIIRANEIE